MIAAWVIYAFIAFFGYFMVNLLMKYVSANNPLLVSLIIYTAGSITMLVLLNTKLNFNISLKNAFIASLIGVFSVTATFFAIKSMNLAPNPGYTAAIYSANTAFVVIAAYFLFNSTLNLQKILGVVATLIGLILLSI